MGSELDKAILFSNKTNSDVCRSQFYMLGNINNWRIKATFKFGENTETNGDAVEFYLRNTATNELLNLTISKQK